MKNKKPNIPIDVLATVDMRLGRILEVELVPKRKKLYKMLVDFGTEKRTVVSGIADRYSIEDLVGILVPFIVNLYPREIAGIASEAMIAGTDADEGGNLNLLHASGNAVAGDYVF